MQVTEHVLFFSYFVVVFISLENCYVDEKDILLIKVLKFLIFCTKKNHHLSLRACLFACLLATDHTSTQEKIKSSGVSRLTISSLQMEVVEETHY
jgi:hypothetical protein